MRSAVWPRVIRANRARLRAERGFHASFTPDGRWLAWAPSAGDHEPGRADHEIFLWKVGEPWEQALRVTYHTGNDQWPDLAP